MQQINLVPDVKQEYLHSKKLMRNIIAVSFLVTATSVGLVVMLALYVYGAQRTHISNLEEDIERDINVLRANQDIEKVLTVQNQALALPDLHTASPEISRLFDYIAVFTPADIRYSSFDVAFSDSGEAELSITGKGADFKTVNIFVDTLKNATYTYVDAPEGEELIPFTTVELSSISKTGSSGGFTAQFAVSIKFDPEIFNPSLKGVEIIVPEKETSVPKTEKPQIFDDEEIEEEPEPGDDV